MKSLRSVYAAAAASLLGLAPLAGCERESPGPRQAILLMLDAARPDRFSCYGYRRSTTPHMDRLAVEGGLFRRHFAQGTYTRSSVSSLMYSRYFCMPLFPGSSRVPYASPSSLFRRPDDAQISFVRALRLAGFKTAAVSAHVWTGEDTAFAQEFDEMHDLATRMKDRNSAYPSAQTVIDHTIKWIRDHKDRDYFLYVHLMDPHYPHHFDTDAQAFFGASDYDAKNFYPSGGLKVHASMLSEEDRRYANALYDGSLKYTDRHVGRLIDFLRTEALIDNTVLAVTADHGENLFDLPDGQARNGRIFAHGGPWWDPVARIPLILRYPPKLEPFEFRHFSEGVDLAPTLLALLDVPLPPGKAFDGMDLTDVIDGKAPPKDQALVAGAIRTAKYKCFFDTGNHILFRDPPPQPQELTGQLYDLVADPHETIDLFRSRPEAVAELLERYRASLAGKFARYEAARSSEQPRSAFAISAKYLGTGAELPQIGQVRPPPGWSRMTVSGDPAIVAFNTDQPLQVYCRMPNGNYKLSVKAEGAAVFEVDGARRRVAGESVFEFGSINVKDERFEAVIRPQRAQPLALYFFGFDPPAAAAEDPAAAADRLRRLRSLGYVGD